MCPRGRRTKKNHAKPKKATKVQPNLFSPQWIKGDKIMTIIRSLTNHNGGSAGFINVVG